MFIERIFESLHRRAEIENAIANAQNALENDGDISDALVEIGDIVTAQDDALCELAEMLTEKE